MKRVLNHILLLAGLVLISACFSGCGKEDEKRYTEKVDLNEYILGRWHSFRAVVYGNGIEKAIDITSSNEYSAAYFEMNFRDSGRVVTSAWQPNANGTARWISGEDAYFINGDAVEIREIEGEVDSEWNQGLEFSPSVGSTTFTRAGYGDGAITMIFEQSSRTLRLRLTQKVNGINAVMNIYFIKTAL